MIDKRNKIAKVSLTNFKINYMHEVIMRLNDYVNVQILGVLYYPEFFP
jgi:hypothetical protein